jgi:hypothetical protein
MVDTLRKLDGALRYERCLWAGGTDGTPFSKRS